MHSDMKKYTKQPILSRVSQIAIFTQSFTKHVNVALFMLMCTTNIRHSSDTVLITILICALFNKPLSQLALQLHYSNNNENY